MQKILIRRTCRNLIKNLPRYLALLALIILSLFMVTAIFVGADTVIIGTEKTAQEDQVEDGQFTVFVPLSQKEEKILTDEGITLEKMFYVDYPVENDHVIRVFRERETINKIHLAQGESLFGPDQVIMERGYSAKNNIHVGDTVDILGKKLTVCGIGTAPDYEGTFRSLSDSAVDNQTFGIAWVEEDTYKELKETRSGLKAEEYIYSYRLNDSMTHEELKEKIQDLSFDGEEVEDPYFQEFWDDTYGKRGEIEEALDEFEEGTGELHDGLSKLAQVPEESTMAEMLLGEYGEGVKAAAEGAEELEKGFREFREETDTMIDEIFDENKISNLEMFLKAENNPRIGCAGDDAQINRSTAPLAGVIILILFSYVIAVFVSHEIERDNTVIGTLYALGVTRKDLLIHYLQLPVLVTFAGSMCGLFLGISDWAVNMVNQDAATYFSQPDLTTILAPGIIVYDILIPPAISILVNVVVISRKLGQPALSMIRNEGRQHHVSRLELKHFGFVSRFRIRQLLREFRSCAAVVFGIFITYLLLMMGLNCYMLCSNIVVRTKEDIAFDYMYTYKYPEEEVPQGGTPVCGQTLQISQMGYKMDVTVMGIEEENPYFELTLPSNQSDVTISDSMATKFGLEKGDTFMMEDGADGRYYAFCVRDIIPYAPGFLVFMDIDQMRDLMGVQEDYFNIVLADEPLDIPSGRLYGTLTSESMLEGSTVFMKLMEPMIVMFIALPAVILVIVMFLMMRVMVDRSAKSISLFRIFGYSPGEIRKLYLDGNFIVVAAGALISMPLSKIIMDALYPYFISNVACGMYLKFPPVFYVLIYIVTLVLYIIIDTVLQQRIKKITPAAVLADRE